MTGTANTGCWVRCATDSPGERRRRRRPPASSSSQLIQDREFLRRSSLLPASGRCEAGGAAGERLSLVTVALLHLLAERAFAVEADECVTERKRERAREGETARPAQPGPAQPGQAGARAPPVSYTHLTLPTIYSV